VTRSSLRWLVLGGIVALSLILVFLGSGPAGETPVRKEGSSANVLPIAGTPPPPRVALESPEETREDSSPARRPVAAPAGEAAPFEVEVRLPGGLSAPGVVVIPWTGETVVPAKPTGSDGVARFEALRGVGGVVLEPPGRPPQIERMELAPGRHVVPLVPGASVTGVVRVKNEPDATLFPMDLHLIPARPFFSLNGIPPALEKRIEEDGFHDGWIPAATDADGNFAFRGLPPDWVGGEIRVARGVLVCSPRGDEGWDDWRRVRLDGPVQGLVIEVMALPAITGRVLRPGGGGGVAGLGLEVVLHMADGSDSPITGGRTGKDGTFRIPMMTKEFQSPRVWTGHEKFPAIGSAYVAVGASKAGGSIQVEIPAEKMAGPWDLGDIELSPVRRIPFLVRDTRGHPITGALGYAGVYSQPTDAEGLGVVESAGKDVSTLSVGARGYSMARIAIPQGIEAPLDVVLEPGSRLEVHVSAPPGTPLQKLAVLMICQGALFRNAHTSMPPELMTKLGASRTYSAVRNNDGQVQDAFLLDPEGGILLEDLVAEVPLTLRVVSKRWVVLHEEPPFSLAPGEHKRIDLFLDLHIRPFRGLVVAPDGAPLSEAAVTLTSSSPGGFGDTQKTHADGRFLFQDVAASKLAFSVERSGFLPLEKPEFEIPLDGNERIFRMAPALEVRVRVEGPDGTLEQAERVTARAPGWKIPDATREEDGAYLQPGLPPEEVTLEVTIGGRLFEKKHDPQDPEAVVEVPALGTVRVRLESSATRKDRESLRVVLRPENREPDLKRSFPWEASDGAQLLFPAVFPGRYSASLERYGKPDYKWTPVSPPLEIEVAAGRETSITFSP